MQKNLMSFLGSVFTYFLISCLSLVKDVSRIQNVRFPLIVHVKTRTTLKECRALKAFFKISSFEKASCRKIKFLYRANVKS